jgi:phage host-nuclease inhibitor protein Gam
MAFADGIVGYRLGQPHLKPLAKWTWKKVLDALEAAKEERFLRAKIDVDRGALLAAAEEIGAEILRDEYGLRVAQEDEPYIEITEES